MTTYKVSELECTLLDAAVAKAEGWTHDEVASMVAHGRNDLEERRYLAASSSWAIAGPIIEREALGVYKQTDDPFGAPDYWLAGYDISTEGGTIYSEHTQNPDSIVFNGASAIGPTPLIAAMRAYVASKLGDTVDL